MTQTVRYLAFAGIACMLLLNGPLLDLLGWPYSVATGPTVLKLPPSTYLFGFGAALALVTGRQRYLSLLTKRWFIAYAAAALLLTVRSAFVTQSSGGELSTALVSFLTPCLALICLQMDRADLDRAGWIVRMFFVVNSLIALLERVVDHRFIPSFLDNYPSEHRAAALLGHPLFGAQLTGQLLVILVIAPKRSLPLGLRIAEITLHILAMFAYGGRSALVFLPFILLVNAIFARNSLAEARVSAAQRLAPFAMFFIGLIFVFLPIPFVESTLQRFTEDNGSANTRSAALSILSTLDPHGLLWGIDVYQRQILQKFFNTSQGIELGWVGLIITYGLVAVLPLLVALPVFVLGAARGLNRAAWYTGLFYLIVSAGSAGLASKGLAISVLIAMMYTLCQRDTLALRGAVRPGEAPQRLFAEPVVQAGR